MAGPDAAFQCPVQTLRIGRRFDLKAVLRDFALYSLVGASVLTFSGAVLAATGQVPADLLSRVSRPAAAQASSAAIMFTKCQMKNQNVADTWPVCPSGYTDIHHYASANVYCDGGRLGFHHAGVDDGSVTMNGGAGTGCGGNYGTYACAVCAEDES